MGEYSLMARGGKVQRIIWVRLDSNNNDNGFRLNISNPSRVHIVRVERSDFRCTYLYINITMSDDRDFTHTRNEIGLTAIIIVLIDDVLAGTNI